MTSIVVHLHNAYAQLRERQQGQAMTEYALILGGIGLTAIVGIMFLGGCTNLRFQSTGSSVRNIGNP